MENKGNLVLKENFEGKIANWTFVFQTKTKSLKEINKQLLTKKMNKGSFQGLEEIKK